MYMKIPFASFVISIALFSYGARADRSTDDSVEKKVDAIVSIFENATPDIQYSYIEALPDGRGYTAGRAGFTTANGDLLNVVQRYQTKSPAISSWPEFLKLLPTIESKAQSESGDLSGLEDLPQLWLEASDDPEFVAAQDEITDELYRTPARGYFTKLGFQSPLAFLVIYDSIIQHGEAKPGDDDYDDSLPALIARTPKTSDEHAFISAFLKVRRADLMNPVNPETANEWRKSVGRVDALQKLVDQNKWDLASPVRIEVWKKIFAL